MKRSKKNAVVGAAHAVPVIVIEPTIKLTPEEKEKAKEDRKYFNSGTQKAICAYQRANEDRKLREQLYVKEIMPAFEKLIENLIFVYSFTCPPKP